MKIRLGGLARMSLKCRRTRVDTCRTPDCWGLRFWSRSAVEERTFCPPERRVLGTVCSRTWRSSAVWLRMRA